MTVDAEDRKAIFEEDDNTDLDTVDTITIHYKEALHNSIGLLRTVSYN